MKTIIICIGLSLFLFSCVYAVHHEGNYKGKVIDAQTGEPIEGVVVLGTWSKEHFGAAGAVHTFYDAKETVTDKNGEFSINGMGLEIMSNITPMRVLIFKAGHEYVSGSWKSLRESFFYREKIKWEGNKAIIPLKKLTMEERKQQGTPSRPNIPDDKIKLMTNEINKDRIERGLDPL